MSIEILLIPAAMAAITAWRARADDGGTPHTCTVRTRLRDRELVGTAVGNLGGTANVGQDSVRAELEGVAISLRWEPDGAVVAHAESADVDLVQRLLHDLDAEYAALVQSAVHAQLLERAGQLGMVVESETVDESNDITLVLAQAGR